MMERSMVLKEHIRFADIKEPKVVGLVVFYGAGTKIFQSYLDGHDQVYNIPAFPLVYLYPHWKQWEVQYQDVWSWDTIINIFCIKHASLLDSRRIQSPNGLDALGEGQDGHLLVEEEQFRLYLKMLLKDEPISRRTFILAVNYAYALCKGEDLNKKKVFLWHHHVFECLEDFAADFPQAILLGFIRDLRAKIYRNYIQHVKHDEDKLNMSDALILRSYVFHHVNYRIFVRPNLLKLPPKMVVFLKHEDMARDLRGFMTKVAALIGIDFRESLLESTFDGKVWWGHQIYGMPNVENEDVSGREKARLISEQALKRVLSTEWKKKHPVREIFVLEGIFYDFNNKYGYENFYFKKDSGAERLLLLMAIVLPFDIEIRDTLFYLNPLTHLKLLSASWQEATGKVKRKYYGFNAAYFFKRNYADFRLWKGTLGHKMLDAAESYYQEQPGWLSACALGTAQIFYVVHNHFRFIGMILCLPIQYLRRLGMYYRGFFRRISEGNILAESI
jgi:hypothetical protein